MESLKFKERSWLGGILRATFPGVKCGSLGSNVPIEQIDRLYLKLLKNELLTRKVLQEECKRLHYFVKGTRFNKITMSYK